MELLVHRPVRWNGDDMVVWEGENGRKNSDPNPNPNDNDNPNPNDNNDNSNPNPNIKVGLTPNIRVSKQQEHSTKSDQAHTASSL